MAIDLVDLVKGYLTPDGIQKAASHVGESNGATQKALAGIVPTSSAPWRTRRRRTTVLSSWFACSMLGSTTGAPYHPAIPRPRRRHQEVMVKGGISDQRIASAGYGQENPVADNDTEQGRAKNRRLELVVVKR